MVKLTYTINSGTRETRATHRRHAPPDLHPEVGDVGRARPVVVIIPLGEDPHDLIDATLKREIPSVTRARLAGLVNQTDFTHDNDFLIGCTMATGRGFLRAPPFPASPFACPVPVSLRSCNRSIQLRNVCDAPGISIPAYAGRSLAVQSIIHYFAAENRSHNSLSVHRIFPSVHRIRPGNTSQRIHDDRRGPSKSRRRTGKHAKGTQQTRVCCRTATDTDNNPFLWLPISNNYQRPGYIHARPGLAWIFFAPRPGSNRL